MSLSPLLSYSEGYAPLRGLEAALRGETGCERAFVSPSLRSYVLASVLRRVEALGRPALLVAGDDRGARDLAREIGEYLSERRVLTYPARGIRYESQLDPAPHIVGLRLRALDALAADDGSLPAVVVAGAGALAERVPGPQLRPHGFEMSRGDEVELGAVRRKLVDLGYERNDQVDDRGQFASRGDILDIFPATGDRPVRLELFGDEIERLAHFSTFTQRSHESVAAVTIEPAAELSAEHRELAEMAALESPDERPALSDVLPLDGFASVFDLVPKDTLTVVVDEVEVRGSLRSLWEDLTIGMSAQDAGRLYLSAEEAESLLAERARISLTAQSREGESAFRAQRADMPGRGSREVEAELKKLRRSGYRVTVVFRHRGESERALHNLSAVEPSLLHVAGPRADACVQLADGDLGEGFLSPSMRIAVIPAERLFRRRARAPAPASGAVISTFADLRPGDHVVHEDHGLARFSGFETRTVAGVTRDYLDLAYRGEDRVFVPVDQLAKITRYVGVDGGEPPLAKLGGKRWDAIRTRARQAAHEMAGELIRLYAERRRHEGHAFPPDGEWQVDFERSFPYAETQDQLEAIDAIKADMEAPSPMDRLLCGDVGFGKTEVALRAAFKSMADGKQVMMLAPTTILSQQHLGTFSERLRDFPFRVEVVSRLMSDSHNRSAIADFRDGKIDLLVGTHRLLARDVVPKDLGLLVVDEEQRFGVKQKENLRQLKLRVDVLALSATPIPRTLQMSLAGLRDISVMEEPPRGRRPVRTYVGEYDDGLVGQAIERESARGGQAFFLHNRVETIDEKVEGLRALCPSARFGVAHGRMEERELERSMLSFIRGDIDCLVCTSIVESGIDIPQANTLLVERADMLGLAQLYQIRGRVGRSTVPAYAYLLYPSDDLVTSEARARLAALSDYTELGSGFKIAMRDLELRGAGNLLGDEQSGHVAAVGFELYCKMIDQAVQEMPRVEAGDRREAAAQGDDDAAPASGREPVRLDVAIDAYVPASYVPYEIAKIDLHRRIAGAHELSDLEAIRSEIVDRFGPPPEPVLNLLRLAEARIKLGRAGVRDVTMRAGRFTVSPVPLESAELRALRNGLGALTFDRRTQALSLRLPADPAERLVSAIALADGILAARF